MTWIPVTVTAVILLHDVTLRQLNLSLDAASKSMHGSIFRRRRLQESQSTTCGVREHRDIVVTMCAAWSTMWLDFYEAHMCQLCCTMSSVAV